MNTFSWLPLTFFFNFLIQLTPWIQYNFCLLESGQCLSPLFFCDLKCSTPMVLVLWYQGLGITRNSYGRMSTAPSPCPVVYSLKATTGAFWYPCDLSKNFKIWVYHFLSVSTLVHPVEASHYTVFANIITALTAKCSSHLFAQNHWCNRHSQPQW